MESRPTKSPREIMLLVLTRMPTVKISTMDFLRTCIVDDEEVSIQKNQANP